jgi:hypothetical protein
MIQGYRRYKENGDLEDYSYLPATQDIGASGVVPSGVSWVQTTHAGGVAITKRRLGFGLGRKKGRKNAIRRHS